MLGLTVIREDHIAHFTAIVLKSGVIVHLKEGHTVSTIGTVDDDPGSCQMLYLVPTVDGDFYVLAAEVAGYVTESL